jgi:NAD(P)-dependent dehydrogenase (short-subunit alcohol dehydrogenase family)
MVALITGAGRGLGKATALELAAHGWDLALLARTRAQIEAVAAQARELGVRAEVFPATVDEAHSVHSAFRHVTERFEGLDALVNCAGAGSFGPVAELDPSEWERIVSVNLTGTFLCCREAVRLMLPQRAGHIVNVLSIAAKTTFPNSAAYCAGKWGALGLTKVLAEEVRREGIRVTALIPGSIDTPFWDLVGGAPFPKDDMLRPEDVAATIRQLLEQPASLFVDEMVVMPPKGIL